MIRHYPSWFSAITRKASPVSDRIPWITFGAIDFLKRYLSSDMKVFEYGTGGSTLFFLDRVESVVSVEHDASWVEIVTSGLTEDELNRWSCHLIEPENTIDADSRGSLSDRAEYQSNAPDFLGSTFHQYVMSIDGYPDGGFDLIMIDGRSRPSCFVHALEKVKNQGYIFWDNTEREHYHETMDLAPENMKMIDFPGPSPYVDFFTRTTAWFRSG